ncbi:E3 ubiquitin-protein ligase PDZRN3-like isoform X3 [Tigriopus californicus]|uniref:E3 ubiquitin-protein ligase PDZRN3-like isoform X3 n=1 Tax=Tigriopus californicus TaxID=6832 RepID=UPI0027DA1BFF|nr:E3 ubiquitin-protein ligase PDZRN3-like isoform X3 [Tigriopus californicus]
MDFVILKVNGRDVSQSTHEEAMEAFLQAQEPITVEVLRRNPTSSSTPSSMTNTQSTRGGGNNNCNNNNSSNNNNNSAYSSKRNSCYFPSENIGNSIAIQTEVVLGGIDLPTSPTRDDLLLPFLDYEEVLLQRSSANERLGLTLCYETDAEDGQTDIFIDDIHPEGLAASDGRLKLGDQIIQINGEDIKTKVQAQEIFLHSQGDISLLVARPPIHYQAGSSSANGDDFVFNDENLNEEENGRNVDSLTTNPRVSTESGDNSLLHLKNNEEYITSLSSNGSTSYHPGDTHLKVRQGSSSSRDSGHADLNTSKSSSSTSSSRTGDSAMSPSKDAVISKSAQGRNPEDSLEDENEEVMNIDKELYYVDKKLKDIRLDCEAMTANNNGRIYLQQQHSFHHLESLNEPIYETIPEMSENEEVYCLPVDSLKKMQSSPKRASFNINNSQHHQLKAKHLPLNHPQQKSRSRSKSSDSKYQGVNRLIRSTSLNKYDKNKNPTENGFEGEREDGNRSAKIKEVEQWLKSTCDEHGFQSTPTISTKGPSKPPPSRSISSHQGLTLQLSNQTGSMLSLVKKAPEKKKTNRVNMPAKMPLKGTMPRPLNLNPPTPTIPLPNDIMYTNLENLHDTMRLQQEILLKNNVVNRRSSPVFQAPPPPPNSADTNENSWEWKVKIRPDGTRLANIGPKRSGNITQSKPRSAGESNWP